MNTQKSIFISHAWGGISDEILAELTKVLSQENISFILDKRDLAYRGSINDFMRELGKADMVIIILSNKYLKSEYCMFELIQIYKNDHLRERIFPIVLDEVKISSSVDRLEFVKYWENQLIELQNKVKELNSLSYIEGITDDLNLYAEIRNNIARLTGILRDINTLNVTIHVESDYRDLIQSIKKKISGESEENKIYISSTKPPSPVFNAFNYKLAGGSLLVIFALFITWKILSRPKNLASDDTFNQQGLVIKIDTSMVSGNAVIEHETRNANGNGSSYKDEPQHQDQPTGYSKTDVVEKNNSQKSNSSQNGQQSPQTKIEKQEDNHQSNEGYTTVPLTYKETSREQSSPDKSQMVITTSKSSTPGELKLSRALTVSKGTTLMAKSNTNISSDDKDPLPRHVTFSLDQPVYDGLGSVAIPSGSLIIANIKSVKKSDYKRPGTMDIVFEYLLSPDGQKIPLQTNDLHLIADGDTPMEIHANGRIKIKTSATALIQY